MKHTVKPQLNGRLVVRIDTPLVKKLRKAAERDRRPLSSWVLADTADKQARACSTCGGSIGTAERP